MALCDRQVFQPDRRIDGAFELFKQNSGTRIDGLPVDQAETALRGMTEKDVFTDGKLIEQHGFLMNGSDACIDGILCAVEVDSLAIQQDFAFVRAIDAGEDLDERGFARAVLADQRGNLARV